MGTREQCGCLLRVAAAACPPLGAREGGGLGLFRFLGGQCAAERLGLELCHQRRGGLPGSGPVAALPCWVVPPAAWQQTSVPLDFAAVVLSLSQKDPSSSSSPSFRKVGSHAPLAELQAKARAGLVRVMVEVDLAGLTHSG